MMENGQFELADRAQVTEAIWKLSEEDLHFLNRVIVERLRLISQARSTVMLAHFSVGDRVSFPTATGEYKAGVIVRINKKTASIATDDGHRWNVHPAYLRAERPEKSATAGLELEARSHGG